MVKLKNKKMIKKSKEQGPNWKIKRMKLKTN